MEKENFNLRDKTICISKNLYDAIIREGYVPLDEDIKKIFSLRSPHAYKKEILYSLNLTFAFSGYLFKKVYGKFVQYLPDGSKAMSDNLYELVKNHVDEACLYSFEEIDKNGIIPKNCVIDFFGSKINSLYYPEIAKMPLPYMLSDIVKIDLKYIKKLANGDEKIFSQDLEWRMFKAPDDLRLWNLDNKRIRNRINTIDEVEYDSALRKLLSRYSVNGKSLFEKVDKIQSYNSSTGIYVLCMKEMRRIYIGQAKSSIGKRVLQHFSHKNTGFDDSIVPSDVTDIYVMRIMSDREIINYIEADCIATIGKRIIANAKVAEYDLRLASDVDYNPNNYLIPKKQFDDLLRLLVNEK